MRYEIGYEGHIDSLNASELTGWVRQIGSDDSIRVSVFVNDIVKLVIVADEERQDLKSRGSGKWGFTIPIDRLKLAKGDKVRVKSMNEDFELQNSPIVYNAFDDTEPWVESDLYSELRKQHQDHKLIGQADDYHKHGYVILKNIVDGALIDQIIADTKPLLIGENRGGRAQDAWSSSPSVKQLALNNQVMELLEFLYGRKPIPFQTLNFEYGTQQPAHSDTIHFSCLPSRYMCGVWVALEDITPDNGPIVYYPKSHRLKEHKLTDIGLLPNPVVYSKEFVGKPSQQNSYGQYEEYIARLMVAQGFEEKQLIIKKGDVLVWASNLIHGGSEIKDKTKTRWSQVTHYYFEGCMYYTPFFSDEISGRYALKQITNIATNKPVLNTYNGIQLKITDAGKNLSTVQL
jgi:ectoine hydroxylase-related dioxygenase (phytanoyl-CoA dioxygenase family)